MEHYFRRILFEYLLNPCCVAYIGTYVGRYFPSDTSQYVIVTFSQRVETETDYFGTQFMEPD